MNVYSPFGADSPNPNFSIVLAKRSEKELVTRFEVRPEPLVQNVY
jgi:hypothetical protein